MRGRCGLLLASLLLAGCITDAATRIGYDIKAGARRVGPQDGARYTVRHPTPSKAGECAGSYKVQLDKVGALIVWCKDASGLEVVSSHSTTFHSRFVETPRTYILEKRASEPLQIELERRDGRILIVDAS